MTGRSAGAGLCAAACILLGSRLDAAPQGAGNRSPAAPDVTEPAVDDQIVNPADVHMETGPFADPDPGDAHFCTDWEILIPLPTERIWQASCTTGVERVHVHLGDGDFLGSHSGRNELVANTRYLLRARHSDDSGDPATQWSTWTERYFRTGPSSQTYPLESDDIAEIPAPRWVDASVGNDVILPPAATGPALRLESAAGDLLLLIEANDGATNTVTNPPALAAHAPLRVRVQGGSLGLSLPASDLLVVDDHCAAHRILLPAVVVGADAAVLYWISAAGATYLGDASQTEPHFGTLARGLSPPWIARRAGFRVEVFADGFQLPVNIAFVPNPGTNPGDPFLYVTELYGAIRVVARDQTVGTYAAGLLDFPPTGAFPGSGEQGLAGLAVDPATGDVFAGLLYASPGDPNVHFPKIVRFTSLDGGRTAASQVTLLDMVDEPQGQSHQISNLAVTPDGKLLCHMGDGFAAATAQNLDSFRGKILRLNLDGTPATDNPFFDATDGINARDYVYAYGVRNPFGGDWRAADGRFYEVENGPNRDRFAQIVPGRNFGWTGSDASMGTFALYTWLPAHAPVNLVFVQPETFGGSGFPASTMGHAFVSESGPTYATGPQLRGKRITEWILDGNGDLVSGPIPFLDYAGTGKATACGLEAGPDGLYMTELYADSGTSATQPGARILRIRFDSAGDCNENGLDDACDIGSGGSSDANANAIPDECETSAAPICFGDGTGSPCPCGNVGLPGHGCDNSRSGTGGAQLSGSGLALLSADSLRLTSVGERANALSVFWQGDSEAAPALFGDGITCLGGNLKRLYFRKAVGGAATVPQGADLPVSDRSAALGDPIAPGTTRVYHVFYRDSDPTFCAAPAGGTVNATNGLRIRWGA